MLSFGIAFRRSLLRLIGHFRVDPSLEAKCEAYNRRIFFKSHANKSHFCYKGFALSAVLKMRGFGTRKCPDQA